MTTITLESPLQKVKKTNFKNEKEMILYFIEVINYDYIDFKELDKNNVDDNLKLLIENSKKKNISEFDNI